MSFERVLARHFPGAVAMEDFISSSRAALAALGFRPENVQPGVGVCRDEICAPFVAALQAAWGPCFSFASLAGAVLPGRTAFGAFLRHAPLEGGRCRNVLFGFTHLALDAEGTPGPCSRPGLATLSSACGALASLHREMRAGLTDLDIDPDDVEYGLLRLRLSARIEPGASPDLVDLTRLAHRVLAEDLEATVLDGLDPERADVAVYTGVQIHGPNGLELVWSGGAWAQTQDGRLPLP